MFGTLTTDMPMLSDLSGIPIQRMQFSHQNKYCKRKFSALVESPPHATHLLRVGFQNTAIFWKTKLSLFCRVGSLSLLALQEEFQFPKFGKAAFSSNVN